MSPKPSANTSTRDRILDAALRSFARHGFTGATTKDIARKAKVNEVTLFRLFKSKKALFAAVLSDRSPVVPIQETVAVEPTTTVEEMLRNNVRIVLRTLRENKDLYFVMMSDAWRQSKTRNQAYEATIKRGIDLVSAMMSRLMDAGKLRRTDPEIAARVLMGAVQFYFLTTDMLGDSMSKPGEEDRMIRGLVSTFLEGMRVSQEGG